MSVTNGKTEDSVANGGSIPWI